MLKSHRHYIIITLLLMAIHFQGYAQYSNLEVTGTTKTGQLIVGNQSTIPVFVSAWFEGTSYTNIFINNSSNSVDEKLWGVSAVGSDFRIFTEKDNFSAIENGLILKRGNGINISHVLFPNGTVGIGTDETGSHKLAVEGSIGAREVKVEISGWSDFVFDENYELRTLEEVENYIVDNKRLTENPSEEEVTQNGINLGEMNAKLMEKIKKLTLYVIQQNKEIKKLQNEVSALKQ